MIEFLIAAILDPDLSGFVIKLPKLPGINNHVIDLKKDKQIFFGLVYKLNRAKNLVNSY